MSGRPRACADAFLHGDRIGIEGDRLHPSIRMHTYTWTPARVLREVESKRAILDWHDRAWENRRSHRDDLAGAGWLLAMEKVVKLLAVPFADRPGYQESWRP